jgi:hypothetical protein
MERLRATAPKLRGIGVGPDTQAHYLGAPNEFEELFINEQWTAVAEEIRVPRCLARMVSCSELRAALWVGP